MRLFGKMSSDEGTGHRNKSQTFFSIDRDWTDRSVAFSNSHSPSIVRSLFGLGRSAGCGGCSELSEKCSFLRRRIGDQRESEEGSASCGASLMIFNALAPR